MRTRLIVAGLVTALVAVAAVTAIAAPGKPAASVNALATQECKQERREDRAEFRAEYGGTGSAAFTRCVKDELR
jgi:hypothetical protein